MWLPMLPADSRRALRFAEANVDGMYNRMGYGIRGGRGVRAFHAYVGKVAESIVHRFLVDELQLDLRVAPESAGRPDRFDFELKLPDGTVQSGDVKSFHIFTTWGSQVRTVQQVERDSWALVPVDQFRGRPKDLYVFAMLLGDKVANADGVDCLTDDSGIALIRWAMHSDVSGWDEIPEYSRVFPYVSTRTRNYGQLMSQCRHIEELALLGRGNG